MGRKIYSFEYLPQHWLIDIIIWMILMIHFGEEKVLANFMHENLLKYNKKKPLEIIIIKFPVYSKRFCKHDEQF